MKNKKNIKVFIQYLMKTAYFLSVEVQSKILSRSQQFQFLVHSFLLSKFSLDTLFTRKELVESLISTIEPQVTAPTAFNIQGKTL